MHLIALGLTRLLLGAYFPSWLTAGVWYGVLACFVAALIVVLYRSGTTVRRQIAACTLLLVACYGMVALGRAYLLTKWSMSTFALHTRYHYDGQLILTILLCIVLSEIGPALPTRARTLALVAWFGFAIVVYARFGTPIDNHLQARQETAHVLASIREALEAQPPGQAVYIANQVFNSMPLPSMFPGWVAVFTIFYPENTVDGRPVYFIERRRGMLDGALRGERTRTLIVPDQPASGG